MRLEPLGQEHDAGLWAVAQDPELWRWTAPGTETRRGFGTWWRAALTASEAGTEHAYATRSLATGELVGSTRFLTLRPDDRGLEIGWTWLARSAQATGINVEAKRLMLAHAFEVLGCLRVELKTHASNARSRGAMERLGASFEGVHRKHRVVPGLGVRDTAWFSVLDDEWPRVRAGLDARLARSG